MKLRHHGRYAFEGIDARPPGVWPGGARVAVYVALNLEQYAFGEGLVEDLVPPLGQPDVMNFAWRDWATAWGRGGCGRCSSRWASRRACW